VTAAAAGVWRLTVAHPFLGSPLEGQHPSPTHPHTRTRPPQINFERIAGYAQGINKDAVKSLFTAADFVAISAYAPIDPWSLQPSDLQKSAQMADNELSWYGVDFLKNKKL